MRTLVCVCAMVAICVCITADDARAELLNLSLSHYPRLYGGAAQVTYVPPAVPGETGVLTVVGQSWEIYEDENGTTTWLYAGDLTLEAVIDPGTAQAVSGSLSVTGDPQGFLEDLFSSAQLTQFGFGGNDLFEFVFIQAGQGIPLDGEAIGVIVSGVSIDDSIFSEGNLPAFDIYFANNGNGYTNTFYLPEPTCAAFLMLAACGAVRRRRR
ncbi:MAG: hypothetical protein HQ546_03555 [Planctomycetes bacterium]|nr:hypothetical protein [Planctomycetota bacterium]